MTTLIPTAILLISLGSSAGISGNAPASQQWRAEVMPSDARKEADAALSSLLGAVDAASAASRGEDPWERASRTVFVIPGPEGPDMAQITEDMAIMCRIFDKTMVWAFRAAAGEVGTAIQLNGSGNVLIVDDRSSTQGLYLDGYGAIFFIPVDFPLTPPRQEQTPVESEPSTDPLWSQTANELRGVPEQRADTPRRQYDAQKVENLKTAVIGVLRHASNLRTGKTRRPQDVIDVVISTRMSQADHREWMFRSGAPQQVVDPAGSAPELPTVLILRTTKIDVDALAKGDLTQEQFTEKVQILKSWVNPGRETIRTTTPRRALPAPPQTTR